MTIFKFSIRKISSKSKTNISTKQPSELLHLDLFGPTQIRSINHNKYVFVIVDDFSRYTWTLFFKHKSDTFGMFKIFAKRIKTQMNLKIKNTRSDHGGEF